MYCFVYILAWFLGDYCKNVILEFWILGLDFGNFAVNCFGFLKAALRKWSFRSVG